MSAETNGYIVNPEAVGDPDRTPVVYVSPEAMRAWGLVRCLAPAASREHDDGLCGGVNGFHADDCTRASS